MRCVWRHFTSQHRLQPSAESRSRPVAGQTGRRPVCPAQTSSIAAGTVFKLGKALPPFLPFDNSSLGLVRQQQDPICNEHRVVYDYEPPSNLVTLSRAFGIPAWDIGETDPRPLLATRRRGPILFSVTRRRPRTRLTLGASGSQQYGRNYGTQTQTRSVEVGPNANELAWAVSMVSRGVVHTSPRIGRNRQCPRHKWGLHQTWRQRFGFAQGRPPSKCCGNQKVQ